MKSAVGVFCLTVILAAASQPAVAAIHLSANVSYVTGSSVYLSAGVEEGLQEGQRLELYRGETSVALLEVRELSPQRAVCSILESTHAPQVGDEVRFTPATADNSSAQPAPNIKDAQQSNTGKASRRGLRDIGIRGRIGLSYLWLNDRLNDDGGYSRPALTLRLDGKQISGTPWGFAVDVRARRIQRNSGSGNDDLARVYRLALSRNGTDDPWHLSLGRQYSADLAAVSIFDGLSAAYSKDNWGVGLFSGTQPAADDFGYSSEISEHGLYFRYGRQPAPRKSWRVTTGLIGSYQNSEPNREFLYVQGRYSGPKLMLLLTEEVDINREWRKEQEDSSLSFSNSYISMRYRISQAISLNAGFDNRRNVRLYRDHVNPETEFDDSFRRALWAGGSFRFHEHYRVGLALRSAGSSGSGDANSYTLTFNAQGFGSRRIEWGARGTHYTNDLQEGWLYAMHTGLDLGERCHLRLGGGIREEDRLATLPLKNNVNWFEVDLEVDLARRFYLLISAERSDGDEEQIDQIYSSLNYRF